MSASSEASALVEKLPWSINNHCCWNRLKCITSGADDGDMRTANAAPASSFIIWWQQATPSPSPASAQSECMYRCGHLCSNFSKHMPTTRLCRFHSTRHCTTADDWFSPDPPDTLLTFSSWDTPRPETMIGRRSMCSFSDKSAISFLSQWTTSSVSPEKSDFNAAAH